MHETAARTHQGVRHHADDDAVAQVRLRTAAVAVQSDPAGRYQLCAVEAGAQTAVVSAPGFVSISQVVVVTAGQQTAVDFSLTPS